MILQRAISCNRSSWKRASRWAFLQPKLSVTSGALPTAKGNDELVANKRAARSCSLHLPSHRLRSLAETKNELDGAPAALMRMGRWPTAPCAGRGRKLQRCPYQQGRRPNASYHLTLDCRQAARGRSRRSELPKGQSHNGCRADASASHSRAGIA